MTKTRLAGFGVKPMIDDNERAAEAKITSLVFLLSLSCLLSACSGSDSDPASQGLGEPFACGEIFDSLEVEITSNLACTDCSVSNESNLIDGTTSTSGIVSVEDMSGNSTLTVRVTNSDDGLFSGMRSVGFFWTNPSDGWCHTISTYRAGTFVDGGSTACIGVDASMSGASAVTANDEFDTLEVVFQATGAGASFALDVPEVCLRF